MASSSFRSTRLRRLNTNLEPHAGGVQADLPAVEFHDLFDYRKADSRAFKCDIENRSNIISCSSAAKPLKTGPLAMKTTYFAIP